MTLNRRLATAAAAIVQRMISRSRPRVFRPVSPFKKGSMDSIAINGLRLEVLNMVFSWIEEGDGNTTRIISSKSQMLC